MYLFFHYVSLSHSKICIFSDKVSAASYSSVLPTLRQCQKARLEMNFVEFETDSSAKIQMKVSNVGLSRMFPTRGELFLEEDRFCSLHENPDSYKTLKSAFCNDFYWILNTYFATIITLTSSIEIPIESLTFAQNESIKNQYI